MVGDAPFEKLKATILVSAYRERGWGEDASDKRQVRGKQGMAQRGQPFFHPHLNYLQGLCRSLCANPTSIKRATSLKALSDVDIYSESHNRPCVVQKHC